jgi:hypothetical protein
LVHKSDATMATAMISAWTMMRLTPAARRSRRPLDQDWLSRGMSDLGSQRADARRYRELKGKEITWALPG